MSDPENEKLDRVRRIVADTLFLSVDEITADSSRDTVRNWDSVQHLNVVLALEQSFGVRFTPEDFTAMTSVSDILENLASKGA